MKWDTGFFRKASLNRPGCQYVNYRQGGNRSSKGLFFPTCGAKVAFEYAGGRGHAPLKLCAEHAEQLMRSRGEAKFSKINC